MQNETNKNQADFASFTVRKRQSGGEGEENQTGHSYQISRTNITKETLTFTYIFTITRSIDTLAC